MDAQRGAGHAGTLLEAIGCAAVPVDVAAIARRCGLRVRYRGDLPDKVAGFLYRGPCASVIVVNRRHPRVRQRFTLAHEIGHWYFRDQGVVFKGIYLGSPGAQERAADLFAAELLMPEHLLRREHGRCTSIPVLARRFGVSRPAMIRRLAELLLA